MPIRTIFLDAGGVLVNPNWQRVSDTLARHGVVASAEALRAAEPHIKRALDRSELVRATSDQERFLSYLERILERAGTKNIPQAALDELLLYNSKHNLWESVDDAVLITLDRLRSLGYKLVVVSNANGTLHHSFTRLGLIEKVDLIFDSHEHGVEKPDPAFFHIALKHSHDSAETTIHVGDFYHIDVVGARAAGIAPVLLDEGGLYSDYDCARISRFDQLVEYVLQMA